MASIVVERVGQAYGYRGVVLAYGGRRIAESEAVSFESVARQRAMALLIDEEERALRDERSCSALTVAPMSDEQIRTAAKQRAEQSLALEARYGGGAR